MCGCERKKKERKGEIPYIRICAKFLKKSKGGFYRYSDKKKEAYPF